MAKLYLIPIFALCTTNAIACICWFVTDKKSVKESIDKADVIVYATVVAENMNSLRAEDSSLFVTDVIFDVEIVWKGTVSQTIKFEQKLRPCGDASYRIGERYIIFGYRNSETDKLETNNCNSIDEFIRPYPFDGHGDIKNYQNAVLRMNQEFHDIKKIITKKTRK